jgi:hypothetical protein
MPTRSSKLTPTTPPTRFLGGATFIFNVVSVTRVLAFLASISATSTAHTADIFVPPQDQDKSAIVTITGTIEFGDQDEFLRKIAPLTSATVSFSSDGGSLIAGLQIGETIRMKNFSTLVVDHASCASACALAWLGGTRRFMGPQAQIGFHAAYDGESLQITSSGNALVGAYLNKLGLPYSAVAYLTSASPNSVTWLSKPDAERLGIEVATFNADRPVAALPNDQYTAIAFSRKNANVYAKSGNVASADIARFSSISDCKKRAVDCTYAGARNQCVALAVNNQKWFGWGQRPRDDQPPPFGTGLGVTQNDAESLALSSCRKSSGTIVESCKVVSSGCAYAVSRSAIE